MTETKIKIEISKDFLDSVLEFQEMQKIRIREVIKTFSDDDINSYKFILLCEYLVLVNGYIEILEDTMTSAESRVVEKAGEKRQSIFLEEDVMLATREVQQALDRYEFDLTGQGISLLTH
tara:strand:+ start:2092 stop:2451 length:360 start_codon:yes stop_codon:yes gene_type:complete